MQTQSHFRQATLGKQLVTLNFTIHRIKTARRCKAFGQLRRNLERNVLDRLGLPLLVHPPHLHHILDFRSVVFLNRCRLLELLQRVFSEFLQCLYARHCLWMPMELYADLGIVAQLRYHANRLLFLSVFHLMQKGCVCESTKS